MRPGLGRRWRRSSSSTSSSIAHAMRRFGSQDITLWDEEDGFFYDVLVHPDGSRAAAAGALDGRACCRCWPWRTRRPGSPTRCPTSPRGCAGCSGAGRSCWTGCCRTPAPDGEPADQLLSLLDPDRLRRVLARLFDEDEFLSPYGIRSLSAALPHAVHGRRSTGDGRSIDYEPGESRTGAVRRQLELARPDLVPGQRAAGRRAAHLRRLPRRRRARSRCRPARAGSVTLADGRRR